MIDGWPTFVKNWENLVSDVQRILAKGPDVGVHVIVSTNGWVASKFPSGMVTRLTSNVELSLDDTDDRSKNNLKVAKSVPFGDQQVYLDDDDAGGGEVEQLQVLKIRGRGTSMDGYHFQAGLPELTIDGRRVDAGVAADAIAKVSGPGSAAARVRMLPKEIGIDEVFEKWQERGGQLGAEVVPFGISEIGLVPAVADFAKSAHLLFTGRPECGLSSGLATIAQSVMRVYRPDQAQIFVVDPHNNLLRVVEGDHLGRYVHRQDQVRELGETLGALFADGCRPPIKPRRSWRLEPGAGADRTSSC